MQGYLTLMGIPLTDLPAQLDAELPADAYSQVPGGADLTDIDPNYMRKVLNALFGLCGLGWGYNYTESGIQNRYTGESGQRAHEGIVTRLEFWYVLLGPDGQPVRCTIPASGGSENRSAAYALKGAITNAIGQAASNIGFQESVYLGQRSHKTVKGPKAKPAAPPKAETPPKPAPVALTPPPPQPTPNGNGNGHQPARPAAAALVAAPLEVEVIEDLDDPDAPPDPGAFVIPLGKHKGQTLAEVDPAWVTWAATKMDAANNPAALELQRQAQRYLAAR